jgi:hypothetical protein
VRVHSLRAVLFGALVAIAVPSIARADGGADAASAASAKDLFEHGRDLRARGNCADALPYFEKAYAVYPLGLGSLRNIAVCHEALNHYASARDAWAALKRAVGTSSDSKYAGWNDDADRAIAKLAPKVARVTIDLAVVDPAGGPAPSEGVAVTVDGQPLASDRLGAPIDRDPGTFVVRATGANGSAPDEQTVALAAGESKHVSLRVTLAAPPAPPASGAEPPPAVADGADGAAHETDGSHASPARTGAWIALGVGAGGIAGAVVSLVLRQTALSDLNQNCPNHASSPCEMSRQAAVTSDVNRGRTASTLLTVFGAVGIVGVATGITLFTLSRPHAAQSAVVLTPTGVSAVGTF